MAKPATVWLSETTGLSRKVALRGCDVMDAVAGSDQVENRRWHQVHRSSEREK